MIGLLRGMVAACENDVMLLDVQGVGYEVHVHPRLSRTLGAVGSAVTLIIETHVREDHIHLYGFANAGERACFRILTTVQGVGVKVAMAILGMFSPEQIAQIILAQDKRAFSQVSGIGPKLAERIVTELKGQLDKFRAAMSTLDIAGTTATPKEAIVVEEAKPAKGKKKPSKKTKAAEADAPSPAMPSLQMTDEVVSALTNLGYARTEAYQAVGQVMQKENAPQSVEAMLPACLKELAR